MHCGAADRRTGIDDDADLGLWDAVVDNLGGVEGGEMGAAGRLSACRRSIVGGRLEL